ncbi:type III effector protein [Streptomyces sp. NPDC050560]|uniref:type III effector protein n=1 Tax=Streptomyces sp. NPDC050560 TaxID=3365630 RepID=UPI0037AEC19E
MNPADRPAPPGPDANGPHANGPVRFLTAAAALRSIEEAVRGVPHEADDTARAHDVGSEQVLASLLLLRQVREQLAGWETDLIETARDAGASWADLAHPLGVASRQAAERRYLRGRPGPEGSTGEQRVQATRERRAAARTTATWARRNAADLRSIAGRITALTDLPTAAGPPLGRLHEALAHHDPAELIGPLAATRPHLAAAHPDLAARLDDLTPP